MDKLILVLKAALDLVVQVLTFAVEYPVATATFAVVIYVFVIATKWAKGKGLSDVLRLIWRVVLSFVLTWAAFSMVNYLTNFVGNRANQAHESVIEIKEEMVEFEGQHGLSTPLPTIPPPVAPASGDTGATNGVRVEEVPTVAVPTATVGLQHEVSLGESLAIIAARYGVTVDAIAQLNGIADPNRITVGQLLLIPPPPGE